MPAYRTIVLLVAIVVTACSLNTRSESQAAARSLNVVSYNIRHGRGNDERVDLERTARVLRELNADVIALQEVDNRVQRSGSVPQADSLGKLLGMHAAFGAFMDYQGGQYGMGLLSRRPILRVHPLRLPNGNEPRVALMAHSTLSSGDAVVFVVVHFDWVNNDSFRFAQASALARVLDTLSLPYAVIGDYNDVPGSRTLQLFEARANQARKPESAHFTFPSPQPVKEIDFIYAGPKHRWEAGVAQVIDERVASDHRPIKAILRLR